MVDLTEAKKVANAISLTREERDICYNALGNYAAIIKRRINAEGNQQIREILGKQLGEIEATRTRFV